MSYERYALDPSKAVDIRSSAKLLNVGNAKYGGDWHSVPHAHSYVELFYIVGGDGQFRIEDQLYPVRANQLVIVNPNVIHTEVSYDAHPLEYIVLGIEGLELSVDIHSDGRFCILDYQGGNDILNCLRNILQETNARQSGFETICQAYMEILIALLMRSISFSVIPTSSTSLAGHPCAIIRRYIDTHYKEQLDLDMLAKEAHVSKYYLSHAFKREYGISPISYQIARRIDESRYLLRETDHSLSQIARLLGFSSASYFSQSFRRSEGTTPMEYRKNAHNEEDPEA